MKQTLVIGSTVVDVFLNIPYLPKRGEDVNILSSEYRIGGCAFNVFKTLHLFGSPALLCSPVGEGIFAAMVRKRLEEEGIVPFVNLKEENGCCYCLVEPDGERSFLSLHGAEYKFSRSWMEKVDYAQTADIFICGLEVEEQTGDGIIDFAYEHPELKLYFAPGPRIKYIGDDKINRILKRRDLNGSGPFLHLNEIEALRVSGEHKYREAAKYLTEKTGNGVVITLGEQGCYYKDQSQEALVPGFPVTVLDTVGAGDTHCGVLIACLKEGMSLEEACLRANRIGAAVVGIHGVVLENLSGC